MHRIGLHAVAIWCMLHSTLLADVFDQIEIARQEQYVVLYELDIPERNRFANQDVPYSIDRSAEIAADSFDRIAYYLELETDAGLEYVWVSFVPDITDPTLLGVPHTAQHTRQTLIQDLHILSSPGSGVTPGKVQQGNIEFWMNNYGQDGNIIADFNESGHGYDDQPSGGVGYGSMQIHNYQAKETLFAFNQWNKGDIADIGIGNASGKAPDWTFARNSNIYKRRLLQVLVRPKSTARADPHIAEMYLHLEGLDPIGPIEYTPGTRFSLHDTAFNINRIQTRGERSYFSILSERTQKQYGPFENTEHATITIGGIGLTLRAWSGN